MPRPTLSAKPSMGGASAQSRNPFSKWAENRKERRMQSEEEASRLIIDDTAKNEATIIGKLESIDFEKSKLPKEVLDLKSDPTNKYGDLEMAAVSLVRKIRGNPQAITLDIRPFDQKLLTLVMMFKESVEHGNTRAARAAKAALIRAVFEIRYRIPQNQPAIAKLFVESNTKYLDEWITLVSLAQVADQMKRNVDGQKEQHQKAKDRYDEETANFAKRTEKDPDFLAAYHKLMNQQTSQDRSKWTPAEREFHRLMVDHRLTRIPLDINRILLDQSEQNLSIKTSQVETLYTKLASLEIVMDPNAMNKYQEAIDDLFKHLAESDAQLNETLKSMDDIEGRIMQLDRAPGSLRAKEIAYEEAQKLKEEIQHLQREQSGQAEVDRRKMLKELGFLTEEEVEQKKKQVEDALQRELEEQTEPELLIN